MDIKDIKELIKALDHSSLTSLSIENEATSVTLEKATGGAVQVQTQVAVAEPVQAAQITRLTGDFIKSPIVGIAYSKPKPDAEAFVQVGQAVKVGQTVCVVEAMKMFNEVKADKSGVISEILFEDGQLVEFDMPLFKVE